MRLPLRKLAAAACLAVFVALVALWVVSYGYALGFAYQSRGPGGGMEVSRGRLLAGWADRQYNTPGWDVVALRVTGAASPNAWLGFDYRPARANGGVSSASVPMAFLTFLPLLAAWLLWKRPTPPAYACRTCGYDLRATPGRCPECGTPDVTAR